MNVSQNKFGLWWIVAFSYEKRTRRNASGKIATISIFDCDKNLDERLVTELTPLKEV